MAIAFVLMSDETGSSAQSLTVLLVITAAALFLVVLLAIAFIYPKTGHR
jgi:hypothetical protein